MKNRAILLTMPIAIILSGCGANSQFVKNNIKATAKYYYEYESFTAVITDNNGSGKWAKSKYQFDHGKFRISDMEETSVTYYKLEKKDKNSTYFDSDSAIKYTLEGEEWKAEEVAITSELNKFKDGAESLFKITNEYALLSWKKNDGDVYSTHAEYGEYKIDMNVTFGEDKLVDTFNADGSSGSGSFSLSVALSEYGTTVVTLPEVAE